ncbi:DNA cytosine methyltransferase, partial [Neisseria meningitidis]
MTISTMAQTHDTRLQKTLLFPSQQGWKSKTFLKPDSHIRLATVFSGIGAVEQAFHRLNLNHTIVFAGDIDPYVKKSYLGNYKLNEDFWHNDITQFDARKFRNQVDILVGGSPCQAFSMVGKRAGLEDTRGTLFYEFARVVDEVQPKIFIYENVKGLLNHDNGKTWKVVKSVFYSLGYDLYFQIMNSKDYGI